MRVMAIFVAKSRQRIWDNGEDFWLAGLSRRPMIMQAAKKILGTLMVLKFLPINGLT
jgi:hypothetical protein